MWKLKIAEGHGPWLYSLNNKIAEEREEVRKVQENFTKNRFCYKPNGDLLMRMQLIKENQIDLSIPPVRLGEKEEVTYEAVTTAVRKVVRLNRAIQAKDGHWPAENAGPLFFTPPLVCFLMLFQIDMQIMVLYFTGTLNFALTPEHIVLELLRYITNHQNEDGGWGFHIDGYSTMLGTTVSYISMHILGVGPDDKALAAGRKWILDRGGATYSPSWGKCYISVFGLYEWSGCNPLPPEFWLFPSFFPMHPDKIWCYCRTVYMPMSYLHSTRFQSPITDLVLQLREEMHTEPYHEIDWAKLRLLCAKAFHMMVVWAENPDSNSDAFKQHLARIPDYLWLAEDGMKVQGFGSQLWDTSLCIQAILETYNHYHTKFNFQCQENPSGDNRSRYRHFSKGAWTFSNRDHVWQVSDCTSEALRKNLLVKMLNLSAYLMPSISSSPCNGGVAVWEPAGAEEWLEKLNPSELFTNIVIEHEYVECTSSAIQTLLLFKKLYPNHRRKEVDNFIEKETGYVEDVQGRMDLGMHLFRFWLLRLAVVGKTYSNSKTVPKLLINSQLDNGDFPQEVILTMILVEIIGVFMNNCMLHYASYRNIFLTWALGMYCKRVLKPSQKL
ncbi:hypothetical protein AAG906_028345 [Vitis piasezkii]